MFHWGILSLTYIYYCNFGIEILFHCKNVNPPQKQIQVIREIAPEANATEIVSEIMEVKCIFAETFADGDL